MGLLLSVAVGARAAALSHCELDDLTEHGAHEEYVIPDDCHIVQLSQQYGATWQQSAAQRHKTSSGAWADRCLSRGAQVAHLRLT